MIADNPATIIVVTTMTLWERHYKAFAKRSQDRYIHALPERDIFRAEGLMPDKIIVHLLDTQLDDRQWGCLHHIARNGRDCGIFQERYM